MQESELRELLEEAWRKRAEGNITGTRELLKTVEASVAATDFLHLGRVFHIYAQLESDEGHDRDAIPLLRKSLSNYVKSGHENRIAHSTRHIADVQRRIGSNSESEVKYLKALEIYDQLESPCDLDIGNLRRGLALLHEKMGKLNKAQESWQAARDIYEKLSLTAGVGESDERLEAIRLKLQKRRSNRSPLQ